MAELDCSLKEARAVMEAAHLDLWVKNICYKQEQWVDSSFVINNAEVKN